MSVYQQINRKMSFGIITRQPKRRGPMNDEQFRELMCKHMEMQTEFLSEINEGMRNVKMIGKVIKWFIYSVGSVVTLMSAWSLFSK